MDDPCRLARQVNKFVAKNRRRDVVADPCRLVRQVKQFHRLTGSGERLHLPTSRQG
jgi:hypothetical protein